MDPKQKLGINSSNEEEEEGEEEEEEQLGFLGNLHVGHRLLNLKFLDVKLSLNTPQKSQSSLVQNHSGDLCQI